MSQPQTVKTEPWSDFPRQAYSIITDDFCHDKLFVFKPTVKTSRGVVKVKQSITSKKGQYSVADEVKLWFDVPKAGSLYAKLKSNDYIKLHYEDVRRTVNNKSYTLYAGLNSNKALDLLSVKLGVAHDSEHCHSDNRLKLGFDKGGISSYHWYNRTMVYHNDLRFGLVTCFDITKKILQKNSVLFGIKFDRNTQGFLRAEVDGFRKQSPNFNSLGGVFDKITLDLIRVISSETTGALEVGYDVKKKALHNLQVVGQYQNSAKEIIKVGVNQKFDISLLVKKPLTWWDSGVATLSAGVHIAGLAKRQIDTKSGFELALNL